MGESGRAGGIGGDEKIQTELGKLISGHYERTRSASRYPAADVSLGKKKSEK